jgi:hypothetical protein
MKGTIITFSVHGSTSTVANAINSAGEITGRYRDTNGQDQGFLRKKDGSFTTLDVPGSIITSAEAISPAGEITGEYGDTDFHFHGFLLRP